jgi:hypothetical protein
MISIKLFSGYGRLLEEADVKDLDEAKAHATADEDCMGFSTFDENGVCETYSYDLNEDTGEETWKKED